MASPLVLPNPGARSPEANAHLPVLDGLRGLAIVLILLFHFGNLYQPALWMEQWWTRCFAFGWCGVDLFFVLSGFLITGILCDARQSPGYFRNFYMRRVLRIFPLYYGVLVFLFLLYPLWFVPAEGYRQLADQQLWLWLYLQNWWIVFTNSWMPFRMNHFWSLAVEEQFYLFWPLIVFACPPKQLLRVSAGLVLLALAVRLGMTVSQWPVKATYVFTVGRLDGFGAGALAALLLRGDLERATLAQGGRAVAGLCALLLAALWIPKGYLAWCEPLTQTVGLTLLAIFFASVLLWLVAAAPSSPVRWLLSMGPLRCLAKYSYGIYVLHFPFIDFFVRTIRLERFPRPFQPILAPYFSLVFLLCASLLSILLGVLSYHLYEKHFLKLKHLPSRKGVAPTTAPPDTASGKRAA